MEGDAAVDRVLEVEALYKSYRVGRREPPRTALSGLSFEVPKSGIVGLLGPNGAGKTTTLKCIVGLVHPQGGTIRLFGREGADAGTRARVGFLPEQPYFDLYLTPRKLLAYYGRLMGMERTAARARISYLLNLVGLEREADITMDKYSKGMLQRIGLAQALLGEPEFLILDEPSSGLDPLGKLQVKDLLSRLKDNGTTILLSSHQLSEIEETCDGVVIIHKGRKVASGGMDELLLSREEFEVVLESALPETAEPLPPSAAWMGAGRERLLVGKEGLNAALQALVAGGASIVEVRQRRMTLEEYFLEKVGSEGWEVGE
jgi:ABC-2 type transport system ATP-binding protein